MIEEQVNEEFLSPHLKPVLAANKGKAISKLQKEAGDVFHERILQFTFRILFA